MKRLVGYLETTLTEMTNTQANTNMMPVNLEKDLYGLLEVT